MRLGKWQWHTRSAEYSRKRLRIERLPPGDEFFLPTGSDGTDDLDADTSEVGGAGDPESWCVFGWNSVANADDVEAAGQAIAVAEDANIARDRDLDAGHDAADVDFGGVSAQSGMSEIDFRVAHEREDPEDPREYPFTFTLDVRQPNGDAVSFRNEAVLNDSRGRRSRELSNR